MFSRTSSPTHSSWACAVTHLAALGEDACQLAQNRPASRQGAALPNSFRAYFRNLVDHDDVLHHLVLQVLVDALVHAALQAPLEALVRLVIHVHKVRTSLWPGPDASRVPRRDLLEARAQKW